MTTYQVSLDALKLFAATACELDEYKDTLNDMPDERARIVAMLDTVHATVERAAGHDAYLIYGVEEEEAGAA